MPHFDRLLDAAVDLVVAHIGDRPAILDVGSGTIRLVERICARRPGAHVTVLGPSSDQSAFAARRLEARGVAHRVVVDELLAVPAGPFDAVVTALSLHRMADDDKELVLHRVNGVLAPDGIFVAAEQVAGPSLHLDHLYYRAWVDAVTAAGADAADVDDAVQQMVFDHPATVADELTLMTRAGLRDVDCFFKEYGYAVLGGWSGSLPRR